MSNIKKLTAVLLFSFLSLSVFAFEDGFTLGLKANFSGSYTDPHINKEDKAYLGAQFMKGMLGFVMNGDLELTYIFDSKKYFKYENNNIFGGLGLGFNFGIGQGGSGQISGQHDDGLDKDIEVYCRVFMTPVLNFGTSLKTYLLKNRLVLGFTIGGKMPLDPHPTYELYSNLSTDELKALLSASGNHVDFRGDVGTLIVPAEMMKKINPLGCVLKGSIEYNQPMIDTMQVIFGAYIQYHIYKPGYVTMPKKVEEAAKFKNPEVNFSEHPIKSFYMNSIDFGVNLGLLFKV